MQPRKSITSRYSITKVNSNYYGSVDIVSGNTTQDDVQVVGVKKMEPGYIWVPYIIPVSTSIIMDGWEETIEEKAERIREERKKKLDRIFKDNI
jgi:hypothetical protein